MMWVLLSLSFFFLNLKDFLFISFLLDFDIYNSFVLMICPLVSYILFIFVFNFVSFRLNWHLYKISFFVLIYFVSFCFLSVNSVIFLIFLELTILPMSILILVFSKEKDKFSSLLFMIFINLSGSVPFMYFIYYSCGFLTSFADVNMVFINNYFCLISFLLVLACKLPVFFFHFWLTKAHVSASGSCSMILASIMLKLASMGLLKFFPLFWKGVSVMFYLLFSACMYSSFIFTTVMIRFFDLKYLVACSSIIHMSSILPLISSSFIFGLASSMYMMVGHGLVSYFLFFMVTFMYENSHNRSISFNKSTESSSKSLGLMLFVYILMNLGLPPFINFLSEMLFCFNMSMISYLGCCLVSIMMLNCVIFTMMALTKSMFGKKMIYMTGNLDSNFVFFFFVVTVFILFSPLLF